HLVHRRGERADAESLDGNEIPLLRGHVVDRRALLDSIELAVEPGDLDVEQAAPILGRLLALRAPRRLQAGVGEGGFQRPRRLARFLGHGRGDERIEAEAAEQADRTAADRGALDEFAPRMAHAFLPKTWRYRRWLSLPRASMTRGRNGLQAACHRREAVRRRRGWCARACAEPARNHSETSENCRRRSSRAAV